MNTTKKHKSRNSGKRKKVYISGPMTGKVNLNYESFHKKADELKRKGYEVANPAEHFGGRQDLERSVYLREDLRQLVECDFIVFLKGWKSSKGAVLEYLVSLECGIEVLEDEHCERCNSA
jgi:Domain of unknown function (DUF4406)